ncbi:nuclear factor Y, subunit B3 [Prunus dulcis]|uniref:Nuclear factor Y, subunit B3 n=1 Tax=Prunus dulcis TaxID=3755 RepID=A0A4Y1R9F5_PRUDU|nr:nuclear factor Y, subunit B3 [Prunus dulcis]
MNQLLFSIEKPFPISYRYISLTRTTTREHEEEEEKRITQDLHESSSSAREHDRFLPIANVSRMMKKGLPGNAKISKDAKETVQECVSEFISFITGEASGKCRREKRKTINGDDLLWAMTTLGFKEYVEPLKIYLHKFREMESEKTAGTGMARQLLYADHHPCEYHDQRQREQLQHLG